MKLAIILGARAPSPFRKNGGQEIFLCYSVMVVMTEYGK